MLQNFSPGQNAALKMSGAFDRGSLIEDSRVQSLLGSMVGPGVNLMQSGIDENSLEEGLPETDVFVEEVGDSIELRQNNYGTNRGSVEFENAEDVMS